MASRRPGPGELVAGASGFVLLLAMFLPWFGVDSSARLPGSGRTVTVSGADIDAWEAFAGIDIVLAIAAALAIALLAASFVSEPPGALTLAAIGGAIVAALLIALRLIDAPEIPIDRAADTAYETGRRLGAFLALLSTAGIAWGANLAAASRAAGEPAAPQPAASPAATAPQPAAAESPAAPPSPAPAARPPRPAPATPAASPTPAAPREPAPALTAGPLGGWTRPAIDSECEPAWRRYDRRLGARYARYFEEHPELVGDQRTSALDLPAALPPGWSDLAQAVPGDAWDRQHLSAKSSQTLALGLLGVAARRDPSLAWLWQALAPLPAPAEPEPTLEFEHVVDPALLGERPRQSSFDVLVDDPNVLIGIETKWRERGVGACLCRGEGAGPLEGARCSRRVEQREPYWDAAAVVFGLGPREPGDPCPISPAYETVRHAAALRALAGADRPAVLALIYDADNPYFAGAGDWPGWPPLLGEHADPSELRLAAVSWQELAPMLPLDEQTRDWAADKHGLD